MLKNKKKYQRTLIYSSSDEYDTIEIAQKNGLRSLHFGTPVPQSETSLKNPYELTLECTRLMAMSLLFHHSPQTVLFLGGGGASLPKFIWKYFPKIQIHIVERSPLVVELAHQYFDLPKNPRIHIHVTDALKFVKKTNQQFDLIFIDLFQGDGLSTLVGEPDFFKNCHKRLKDKNSILIWNTWKNAPEQLMLDSIYRLGENFGRNLLILPDKQELNYIFLVFSHAMPKQTLYRIVQRAHQLEKRTRLDFLGMLADLNFLKDYGFITLY